MHYSFLSTDLLPQRTDLKFVEETQTVKERLYKEQDKKCNGCGVEFLI